MGGVLLGTPFLMTMETWWHAWTLPVSYVLLYALVGIALIMVVDVLIGFRKEEEQKLPGIRRILTGAATLVFQSFLAAYVILLVLGVIEITDPPALVARTTLIQLLPLGLGAALANRVLHQIDDEQDESSFGPELGAFLIGTLVFILPIAPTEEIKLIATYASWPRLALVTLLTLTVGYVTLFLLEFRGQGSRLRRHPPLLQFGDVCIAYSIAVLLSGIMLAAFGHFQDMPLTVWPQLAIVLAFPGMVGGCAVRVIL